MRKSFHLPHFMAIALILLNASLALAQDPAQSLSALQSRIKVGDNLRVIDLSGKTTQGRFDGISGTSLRLTVSGNYREFPETSLAQVRVRRPDSVWNGTIAGAVSGAIGGAVIGGVFGDCGKDVNCKAAIFAAGTGIGAGTGFLCDFLRVKHQTVFVRTVGPTTLHLSPILSKERKGAMVSMSFGSAR